MWSIVCCINCECNECQVCSVTQSQKIRLSFFPKVSPLVSLLHVSNCSLVYYSGFEESKEKCCEREVKVPVDDVESDVK